MTNLSPGRRDAESPRAHAEPPVARAGPSRSLRSADLLGGEREIAILHNEETYRLRLTAAGKLILTK